MFNQLSAKYCLLRIWVKKISFLFLSVAFSFNSSSQNQKANKNNDPSGMQNAISVGAILPVGKFSSTHFIGTTAYYSWSNHRFGRMDVKPLQSFGFTANTGVAYYFGKNETVRGYPYKYPGYFFIHTYAGAIYNPWRRTNISLTAGPALGIYNGNTQFNIGSILEGSYFINENIGIAPSIILMKENGADALYAISIKAVYSL